MEVVDRKKTSSPQFRRYCPVNGDGKLFQV